MQLCKGFLSDLLLKNEIDNQKQNRNRDEVKPNVQRTQITFETDFRSDFKGFRRHTHSSRPDCCRYHNVGILVLFLHDINDIQLEFTKLNIYLKSRGGGYYLLNDVLSNMGSISFSITWCVHAPSPSGRSLCPQETQRLLLRVFPGSGSDSTGSL